MAVCEDGSSRWWQGVGGTLSKQQLCSQGKHISPAYLAHSGDSASDGLQQANKHIGDAQEKAGPGTGAAPEACFLHCAEPC
jgi:hypothetical protein